MGADHDRVTEPRLRSGDRSLLYQADTLALLAEFDNESIDAVVTDPPYGLEFMGKEWDSFRVDERAARWSGGASGGAGGFGAIPGGAQLPSYSRRRKTAVCAVCGKRDAFRNTHECGDAAEWRVIRVDDAPVEMRAFQNWCTQWAAECYRILKPGGHLLAFGGTRTYHRLACAVEDVGFDVRDSLMWLYGSGFPKSLDVAKAIDKAAGVDREVIGTKMAGIATPGDTDRHTVGGSHAVAVAVTAPATAEAIKWDGWGTALKPAHEPIVVARKPTIGSVRENVVAHGTGAINIDATRVAADEQVEDNLVYGHGLGVGNPQHAGGRWPPNVLLSHAVDCTGDACGEGCPVGVLDEQSGYGVSPRSRSRSPDPPAAATWSLGREGGVQVGHDDAGGASRFFPRFADEPDDDAVARDPGFMYVPKASTVQRNSGLDALPEREVHRYQPGVGGGNDPSAPVVERNVHPTVKPVGLMRWLVRLVTPPGGIVLDPFAGSGSTLVACIAEGVEWIGVEREAEYCTIIVQRVAAARRAVRAQQAAERVRVHREQQG